MDWIELGYLGLFIATFLAATIVPFSSEAILSAMLFGEFDVFSLLIVASIGNTLGGMTSYGLGRLGDWKSIQRFLRTDEEKVLKWKIKIEKHGAYMAMLCWAPFIGDVIAIALGIFRANMWRTLFWMALGKTLRYAVIIWLIA